MSTSQDLKPCPFCGSEPRREFTAGGSELFIACKCGVRMFGENDLAVVEAWNRRVVDQP